MDARGVAMWVCVAVAYMCLVFLSQRLLNWGLVMDGQEPTEYPYMWFVLPIVLAVLVAGATVILVATGALAVMDTLSPWRRTHRSASVLCASGIDHHALAVNYNVIDPAAFCREVQSLERNDNMSSKRENAAAAFAETLHSDWGRSLNEQLSKFYEPNIANWKVRAATPFSDLTDEERAAYGARAAQLLEALDESCPGWDADPEPDAKPREAAKPPQESKSVVTSADKPKSATTRRVTPDAK